MAKKITPFLWFDGQAEEAAKFYVSVFSRGKVGKVRRWGKGTPAPEGSVMSVDFTIEGVSFVAFNGGPHFKFTPAFSLSVDCKDQKEIDALWRKLTKGGAAERCGWLRDRFGMSWQIVPSHLDKLLQDPGCMQAMLTMDKLDVRAIERAATQAVPLKKAAKKAGSTARKTAR